MFSIPVCSYSIRSDRLDGAEFGVAEFSTKIVNRVI